MQRLVRDQLLQRFAGYEDILQITIEPISSIAQTGEGDGPFQLVGFEVVQALPDNVVAACPNRIYPRPTSTSVRSLSRT